MSRHEHTTNHLPARPVAVHVISPRALLTVFALLIALTVLTVVAATTLNGVWEVWSSIGIACIKAGLVALYFMHLRYDKPFNSLILVAAIGCIGLFLALVLADVQMYQPSTVSNSGPTSN